MAIIPRDTRIRLEEEAMPGSTVEARQAAQRKATIEKTITPTPKEIAAMPGDVAKRTISAMMQRSEERLNELLGISEKAIAEFTQDVENLPGEIALLEAEALAAQAAGEEALAAGNQTIIDAIQSGEISYPGLSSVFKGVVNTAPQYATAQAAGLTAAGNLLASVGVNGLMDVMDEIRALYPDISSEDALNLLRYDKRFNAPYLARFSGNKMLMDAGFAPLDDKEYLATEKAFSKIFTAYDLKQFNNRDKFASLIGQRISADELASRVSLGYDRIIKGAAETRDALNRLFPELNDADILAYTLDPVNQLPAIQRKIQAAEIGGAALVQGLSVGLQAAPSQQTGFSNVQRTGMGVEQLAAQGVDLKRAREGFQAVAEVLPTAEKLSSIYGNRMEQYGRLQAEQEEFQGLASAKRAKQRLREAEIAQFSGRAGTSRGISLQGPSTAGML